MTKQQYVCVIGGANIDIIGRPYNYLKKGDSSPGNILRSFGGVGRNIAENLSNLGVSVELISVLGNDLYSNEFKERSLKKGIGLKKSLFLEGDLSSYLCLNDKNGDMMFAVSDMKLLKNLTPKYIMSNIDFINNSAACVIDANLSKETVETVLLNCTTKVFLDPVSTQKTKKIKEILKNFYLIKPNLLEAEVLAQHKIKSPDDISFAAQKILKFGIENVFISMGEHGTYYLNQNESGMIKCVSNEVISTTGAGDSFMAALVFSYINGFDIKTAACLGSCIAGLTVRSSKTVSDEVSYCKLKDMMKNIWGIEI